MTKEFFAKAAIALSASLLLAACGGGGGSAGTSSDSGNVAGVPRVTNGLEVWDFSYTPVVGQAGKLCMSFSMGTTTSQIGASKIFVDGYLEASDMTGTVDSAGNVALASVAYPIQFSALVDAAATAMSGTFSGTSALGSGTFAGGRVAGKYGCSWEQFAGQSLLDMSSTNDASLPAIAIDAQDRPVVAFVEEVQGQPVNNTIPFEQKLYVKRWSGSQWVQLGGALNTGNNDLTHQPRLVLDASGNPVVAWTERNKTSLVYEAYVKRWNSTTSAWDAIGGALNRTATEDTYNKGVIVDAGGSPVVALTYYDATAQRLDTRVLRWDGAAWGQLGSTLFDAWVHDVKKHPTDGTAVILYEGWVGDLYATRWNAAGNAWASLGSGSIVTTVGQIAAATLAWPSGGAPVVVYDYDYGAGPRLAAMTVASGSWTQLIPGVSFDPVGNKMSPRIAVDPTDNRIVVAAATNSSGGLAVKKAFADRWKELGNLTNPYLFSAESPALAFDSSGRLFAVSAQAATAGNRDVDLRVWPTPK